jgi:hypothetical protein
VTGRLPVANGIRAAAAYQVFIGGPRLELLPDYCFAQALVRFGFLHEDPHTAASLQARPLWSILSDNAVSVGVVGFPITHPAPPVHGYLVSDEFHRQSDAVRALESESAVSPSQILAVVRDALEDPPSPDPEALVADAAPPPQSGDARPDPAPVVGDRMHLQIMNALAERMPAQFLAVRFPGVDAIGHYYLRFANPSAFGDVSASQVREEGRVLTEYYSFVDTVVGQALEALQPGDLLLVVSAFGMEPLSPGKRLLEQLVGDSRVSGTHERAPDGFLLAFGSEVAGGRPSRASLVDLTPTILYYLGLPVGRDMDGYARTDLFRLTFTASRPVTFIPTYGR